MFNIVKRIYEVIETQTVRMNIWLHFVLANIAFALWQVLSRLLDISYAASQFPVPFPVGQTAFDGDVIKGYYASMIDAGTLNIYWQTQFLDFLFIAAVAFTGLLLPSFVARLHKKGSWMAKITSVFVLMLLLGAFFDVLENLVSFVMLSQPATFPNWIAVVYSSFAVLKFMCMIGGMVGTMVSLVLASLAYLARRLRMRSATPALG